ncbi:membrane-spanning 4-domains subfamily A member 4D-like [Clupea harengus]|uniref:Membrane-spanning 4-domains subfamily A member 4D-like n=1 Tax=Clupea harengus TaxID=7950 RepID=A0A8M1KRU9_CLUHA|nr:membrane-spanning 4-domains subfamily A member 4D-like [Clupea harengus]
MANSVPSANGFVVVTHVYPQQDAQSATSPPSRAVSPASSPLGKFLKGEPAALGTVQIMTGVVVMLLGIVTVLRTASSDSGIMFWGAIIYITAGSLNVAANKKLSQCLVKASLGMNIISTITAGIAIILHSFNVFILDRFDESSAQGIAGVMIVLSLLEFIVSICVSAFVCKATCCSNTEVSISVISLYSPQVVFVSSQVPPSLPTFHLSAPQLNPSEMPLLPTSVERMGGKDVANSGNKKI